MQAAIVELQASALGNRTNVLPTAFVEVFSVSVTRDGLDLIVLCPFAHSIARIMELVSVANAFAMKDGMGSVVQLTHILLPFALLDGLVANVLSTEIALVEFVFAILAGADRCAISPYVPGGQTNVLSVVNVKTELVSVTTVGLVQTVINQHAHRPFLASNVLVMDFVPMDNANASLRSPVKIVLQESVVVILCATTRTVNAIQTALAPVAKDGREQLVGLESALDQMVLNVLDVEIV
jgi:hypothetical protein